METEITKELLEKDGWINNPDDIGIFLQKPIENRNPINDTPEDTDIKLVIHGFYNTQQFAVLFPDGAMLNFMVNSMEELKDFESKLYFFDCSF